MRGELRQSHRLLLAGCEILHLRHAARDVVIAEDDRGAGADAVGAFQSPAQVAAIGHLRADAGMPQRSAATVSAAASALSPIGTTATVAGAGGGAIQQHGQALDARGPADGRRRRAAHLLDQTVVAPARHHGALRAELGGDEFECGVAVVVEAAHDARVLPERHAEALQMRLQRARRTRRRGSVR